MLEIIIPYYKLTFFEKTLQSLENQTDKRFKVFIGDDAGSENPAILINKFKGKFNFEYHRFEKNLGRVSLVHQWNRCIDLSKGLGWILILGDDDVLEENVVEKLYENFEEINNLDINVVRFATQKINDMGEKTSEKYYHPKIENSVDFFFRPSRSSLSEYVFNKEKLRAVGFKNFPLAWFSDILAYLEVSNFGNIYTINEAIVYVRISELSITGSKNLSRPKTKSVFEFYYYLLSKKSHFFSSEQKLIMHQRLENSYLNNKRNGKALFKISLFYLSKGFLVKYINFIKSILYKLI